MHETLLLIGIVCILGAIVGGGLRIVGVEFDLIKSVFRQLLLAIAGCVLIWASFIVDRPNPLPTGNPTPTPKPTITSQPAGKPTPPADKMPATGAPVRQ